MKKDDLIDKAKDAIDAIGFKEFTLQMLDWISAHDLEDMLRDMNHVYELNLFVKEDEDYEWDDRDED